MTTPVIGMPPITALFLKKPAGASVLVFTKNLGAALIMVTLPFRPFGTFSSFGLGASHAGDGAHTHFGDLPSVLTASLSGHLHLQI